MGLQKIQDSKGEDTGVFIPIEEWRQLKKQFKALENLEETPPSKDQLLQELHQAISQLQEIEKGTLNSRPAIELLNEL